MFALGPLRRDSVSLLHSVTNRVLLYVCVILVMQKMSHDYEAGESVATMASSDESDDEKGASLFPFHHIPTISIFSGDHNGATSYDMWVYEVKCLISEKYPTTSITHAIRRSLRGNAKRVVMCLGPDATVEQIIHKLGCAYGNVRPQVDILKEFYTVRQDDNEDVASWGCRLEGVLMKAKALGNLCLGDTDKMLKERFWSGLKSHIKSVTVYEHDKCNTYGELLVEIRKREAEMMEYDKLVMHRQESQSQERERDTGVSEVIQKLDEVTSRFEKANQAVLSMDTDMRYETPDYEIDDCSDEPICYRCHQPGHIAIGCRVRLDHSRRSYMYDRYDGFRQHRSGRNARQHVMKTEVVGDSNEVSLSVQDVETRALIDTGSTVSTVSHAFYQSHLSNIPIEPLSEILKIECANGEALPYYGYVTVKVGVYGMDSCGTIDHCILLVVPDTKYNYEVPVLIGTNVISVLLEIVETEHGPRYLQTAQLHTPGYLALRCLTIREKELTKNKNVLALVKSAEHKSIRIPPNSEVVVQGYLDNEVQYQPVCGLLQASSASYIPHDFDISPVLVNYHYKKTGTIHVHITNVTTQTINVPPRAILCEVQPVSIEEKCFSARSEFESEWMKSISIDTEHLSVAQVRVAKSLIEGYTDIFSMSEDDIGHSMTVKHRIELADPTPFKQRHRRIPPGMFEEVRNHLQMLLSSGMIRRSKSPWSSNVVLCRKKDGKLRMCIDYRQLNQRTVKDSYALPRIDEILEALIGNKYFTVLDMKAGYHKIEVAEEHKERTAFTVGPLGFYEYNRMPFGLVNAPATYQRMMEDVFYGLHLDICFIYLDDLIIFSKTFEEHIERLDKVFARVRQEGLKLSPSKCEFMKSRVKYVGHIVSEAGIEPDPSKIEKVKTWPRPSTPEEVRQFIGFIGYYRKFIKNFSKIAKPLHELMPAPKKKAVGRRKSSGTKPGSQFIWTDAHEEAFQYLKSKILEPPILGYPNYDLPFELHVDASFQGLGAVLYQKQDGFNRVIAYASRGLNPAERNYPVHKLEFLSLKWSVTEKFADYLYRQKFLVLTDNNPLTYVLTSAKLDATSQRWIAALSAFDFSIQYRPGKNNEDADAMSRLPGLSGSRVTIPPESIKAMANAHTQPYVHCLSTSVASVNPLHVDNVASQFDLHTAQHQDPVLSYWIECVKRCYPPRKQDLPMSMANSVLLRNFDRMKMRNGVLCRDTKVDDQIKEQIVLPASLIPEVLRYLHNRMGHPGRDKTLSLVRDRFFWPGMTRDIEDWIKGCKRCLLRKSPDTDRAPLHNIVTYQPLELVCMDFLTLEPSKGGHQYVLVITDHFTRYALAIPTRNTTARTTAAMFFNHFVVHYGLPKKIHSDQGPNFESKITKELCEIMGVEKSRTTPYHPMGNGVCERFNRTLMAMLGTLEADQKRDWKSYLGPITHAYNSMRQDTTGQSPYFLMFGREPRLPVDLAFGIERQYQQKSMTKYVEDMKKKLVESYDIAAEAVKKSQARQKKVYDRKSKGAVIQTGDRVLVKVVAFDGKHKLADKWEEEPYVVLKQPNEEIPVYVVQKESGEGRRRTLHRNLLLPIGHLLNDEDSEETERKEVEDDRKKKPTPAPRRKMPPRKCKGDQTRAPPAHVRSNDDQEEDDDHDSDDTESDRFNIIIRQRPALEEKLRVKQLPPMRKLDIRPNHRLLRHLLRKTLSLKM